MGFRAFGFGLLLLTCSCGAGEEEQPASTGSETETDACYELPAGTQLPRFSTGNGGLVISYVSQDTTGRTQLRLRTYTAGGWSAPDTLASGENWFVNWADYPSVVPLGDAYFFHYLAYSGEGTYDYDIRYGTGGRGAQVLHNDGIAAEHGFVSSAPLPGGGLQLAWLDGRFTKVEDAQPSGHAGHHGDGGAMSLRTATLTADGTITERTELDHRVCDCCSTTTVATDSFTMVAYRDRTEAEIRDIAYVIKDGNGWSDPRPVHADRWEVTGCPVNGPALAASAAGAVAIAWYTAAGGTARIQFARYAAGGFGDPIMVDDRDPLGRVDLALGEDGTAYLLGLAATDDPDRAAITLWTINLAGDVSRRVLAETASARSSGFPRLARWEGGLWYAYTEIGGEDVRVRICEVTP